LPGPNVGRELSGTPSPVSTALSGYRMLSTPQADDLRGKRDRAIFALLIRCGLRRAELVGLGTGDFQIREDHRVITDLIG
jgi:integrase